MAAISSLAWGNTARDISQPFANTGYRPDWYGYSKDYGHPSGVHIGVDVSMPCGTKIYALNDGEVTQSGFNNSFRPYPVYIKANGTGYIEIYGHLQQGFVSTGQQVKRGQLIGLSGEQTVRGTTTPDGSGCHIHFELRKPDAALASGYRAIDPGSYLGGAIGTPLSADVSSGGGGVLSILPSLQQFGAETQILARRSFFVVLGVAALFIGLTSILSGGGFVRTAKRSAKTVATLTPVGRGATAANAVRKAAKK